MERERERERERELILGFLFCVEVLLPFFWSCLALLIG